MATTFNFTVRAEDDQGAFADRDFSMTVRNTSVDRYLITTATDAYTSPDMVTWTKRIGQGGSTAKYGGGKWLILMSGVNYRLSSDGINFTQHSFPATMNTSTTIPTWLNDRWIFSTYSTSGATMTVYQSFDGQNWDVLTSAGNMFQPYQYGIPSIHEGKIYISAATGVTYGVVDIEEKTMTRLVGAYPTASLGSSPVFTSPKKINDLWVVYGQGTNGGCFIYSTDMITWNAGPTTTNMKTSPRVMELKYNNGVIYTELFGAATLCYMSFSKDAKSQQDQFVASLGGNLAINTIVTKGKMYMIYGSAKKSSSDLGATWVEAAADFPSELSSTTITGIAAIQ